MFVTRLKLENWMNFRSVDVPLGPVTYLLGPNASGKSNFLDVFRFLRDISKPGAGKSGGGGIQNAIESRHGVPKIRCLHARRQTDVEIVVELADDRIHPKPKWEYTLAFTVGDHNKGVLVKKEVVRRLEDDRVLLSRPSISDTADQPLMMQTHLEQMQSNAEFREIAAYFSSVMYLHLVPQLLKYSESIGGRQLEGDPFGQGFLDLVARTPKRQRDARLKRISKALATAGTRLTNLEFAEDETKPHLKARYAHHRPKGAWQMEDQFSDGTLRLIALLWALQSDHPMLLLEEPELSLNVEIVKEIPGLIDRVQRQSKNHAQVIISTHSEALLSNLGIDPDGVLVIEPGDDGSHMRVLRPHELDAVNAGLSVSEVVLPSVAPKNAGVISQLTLFK